MSFVARVAGIAIVPCFLAVITMAQVEQATLTGAVTDQSDALVARATITVTNVRTGVKATTQTNAEGYYSAPYLTPGDYEVTVQASGFKTARVSDITLRVGLTATVNIRLEVGTVQNEVQVTAQAVQLEQQNSALGNVVGSSQMLQLPLSGRNPYSLVTLAAGVMPAGNTGTG